MRHVARLDAVERARLGDLQALLHAVEERVADGPARHADRALDDLDVLLVRLDVALLESRIGVALVGGDEARPHLHAVGAQRHDAVDVLARIDAAAGDHRNAAVVLGLEGTDLGHDLRNDGFERIVLVGDLVGLVTQVAARLGTLDHDGVGDVLIFREPFLAQDLRGARRRNDRSQFGLGVFREERRQVQRKPRTREDDVGLLGDGGLHHVGEVGHGDHDVDADDALRRFAGLAKLLLQPPDRGGAIVLRIVVIDRPETGRRDDADTALIGHGRCQARKGDAYAHTALNDGHGGA